MVIPHLMLDLKNKNLKTQTGWNFIPFTIRHLLSMVSCERNGRQQTTHPPERTQNRPWNKFHRRTFTVSPLVINLLRWKMNAMPPLCWNTGQHTDNTKKRAWNLRDECMFHHIKLTISSLHRPWRRETYYRKNIFYGCETTMKWAFFDSCLLSPKKNLACINRDFNLLKKVVTKQKRDLRTRSRKYESMHPYVSNNRQIRIFLRILICLISSGQLSYQQWTTISLTVNCYSTSSKLLCYK